MNQPIGVRRASAIELILSVTDANVCPAPITAGGVIVLSLKSSRFCIAKFRLLVRAALRGRPFQQGASSHRGAATAGLPYKPSFCLRQFRICIAHGSKISRSRSRVQLAEQAVVPLLGL